MSEDDRDIDVESADDVPDIGMEATASCQSSSLSIEVSTSCPEKRTADSVVHMFCAISRLRCAFSESQNCVPISRLRAILEMAQYICAISELRNTFAESRDCTSAICKCNGLAG